MPEEIEPIAPEKAREILEAAIREKLGPHWDDPNDGWALLSGHDYMARLNRGRVNLDFYVDLLGNVTIEKKELSGAQESGRIVASLLILMSLIIAVLIARIMGLI